MTAPPQLTPEQAEQLTRALRDVAEAFRRMAEAITPAMAEACRAIARAAEAAQTASRDDYALAPPPPADQPKESRP